MLLLNGLAHVYALCGLALLFLAEHSHMSVFSARATLLIQLYPIQLIFLSLPSEESQEYMKGVDAA